MINFIVSMFEFVFYAGYIITESMVFVQMGVGYG